MYTPMLGHAEGSRQKHTFIHRWPHLVWVWWPLGSLTGPGLMIHREGSRGLFSLGGLGNTNKLQDGL